MPSNPSPKPVLGDKALSENQSDNVGDSDNGDSPDSSPPSSSPVTPTYNSPSGDSGGELLNDDEMAAWHSRLNACQTLDDAMDFHTALQNLSKEQRDSLESTIPESKWVWLWNLPEATPASAVAIARIKARATAKFYGIESSAHRL